MLILLKPFIALVDFITPGDPSIVLPDGSLPYIGRHIANIHSIFNIMNVCVFLPFLRPMAGIIQRIIKTEEDKQEYQYTHLAHGMLNTPDIAMSQVRVEVKKMSDIAMEMLINTEVFLQKSTERRYNKISEYEQILDGYKIELMHFTEMLSLRQLSEKSKLSIETLRTMVSALEEIGDQAAKLMASAAKITDKKLNVSAQAKKELSDLFESVLTFARSTFGAFFENRLQNEDEIAMEDRIDALHKQFRKNHLKRLQKGICSLNVGLHYVDMLNALEKIGDHTFTVAQININHRGT
jgi:phosphate:Na+ symporter